MKQVPKMLIVTVGVLFILTGCGHRQNPTGGKADTEKVTVLASTPENLGDIASKTIEFDFSKNLDRSTVPTGIYIYPPINRKQFKFDGNRVIMRIMENLSPNTNYYVTLTPRIQDERGNTVAENQTYIFSNGKLQNQRISGRFLYEEPADAGKSVTVHLLTADSLLLFTRKFSSPTYEFTNLNPEGHVLRAFIDKNLNGRYDFGAEPYAEDVAANTPVSSIDLKLAYADSSRAVLKTARVLSNTELDLEFSEPVQSMGDVKITAHNGAIELPVYLMELNGKQLTLLTDQQDTLKYEIAIRDVSDRKGNLTKKTIVSFLGIRTPDKTVPRVIATVPRTGTSVADLQPVIQIHFSELIPKNKVHVVLTDVETKQNLEIRIVKANSKILQIQPQKKLVNYHTYHLIIESNTADFNGNKIGSDYTLEFLPLIRETKNP